MTQCIPSLFTFQNLGAREVVAAFDGGKVTTDSGTIRSWLSWSAKKIRWAKTAFASVIAAKPWPAKARSIVWN